MQNEYLNICQLIGYIKEPNKTKCLKMFNDYKEKMITAPGSKTKHQAWPGGYIDHLEETMNFAVDLYNMMMIKWSLSFSESDAMLVLFLHDIEKPFKYTDSSYVLETEKQKWQFLNEMVNNYKIELTAEHWNALKYAHGEGNDYHPIERVQGPLGAFVHICDVASARIGYDYPKK